MKNNSPNQSVSLERVNLLGFRPEELRAWVKDAGHPAYRADQLIKWIHQKRQLDVTKMTNISKKLTALITAHAELTTPVMTSLSESTDGTMKWLCRLKDGLLVETVFIPEPNRGTLCVSSQVGCALNCRFCATGAAGFNRNLTADEIIGQLWLANDLLADRQRKVTNVVMMGMGEPLLNYNPVVAAMDLMLSDLAYGLSKYRVTLSTSGLVPQINQLKQDLPVALAVSLHAPNDELRNKLVPINKKYPLDQLMQACRDYYPRDSKRVTTMEYVMMHGVNDELHHAKELAHLLKDVPCKLNLIPFNHFPGTQFKRSAQERIDRFQQAMMRAGISTWVRRTRGEDIDGACGQLAGDFKDRTGRSQRFKETGRIDSSVEDFSGLSDAV